MAKDEQPAAEIQEGQFTIPLIIGVGASAGSIESIERFFAGLTLDSSQAVVLVLQYRDSLDGHRLPDIFHQAGISNIVQVEDGSNLEAGAVHICPSNLVTTIQNDRFSVRNADPAAGERAAIDSFLVSLAEERAEQAIGVVLAGTGGDGTLGVATLKDHGGLAIAEKLDGDLERHLSDSSAPAAIADFILPPEQIPEHIQVYARHLRRLERQGFDEILAAAASSLSRIADILRNKTGNDFHGTSRIRSFDACSGACRWCRSMISPVTSSSCATTKTKCSTCSTIS